MPRFYRDPKGAIVAGVSTGLATTFGCTVWLVRMCWVLLALLSLKLAILVYLILALILPARCGAKKNQVENSGAVDRVQQLEDEFRELEKRLGS